MQFNIEKQRVDGGTIGDYVKGKQKTAYSSVWLDFSGSNSIRCSVQCGSFLRILDVSPSDTLLAAIQAVPTVDTLTSSHRQSHTLRAELPNLAVKVDGKSVAITSKAGDSLHYGSVITLSLSDGPFQPPVNPVAFPYYSNKQTPTEDAIHVFISDDFSVPVPMGFLSSDHPLDSLSKALSVRLSPPPE